MTAKILTFDGSGRKGSMNHKLLLAVSQEAEKNGAVITHIHLPDFDLPMYDADLEKDGLPEGVVKLKELFTSHHGFLIASPEYNGGYSPLLKNAIDWVSRRDKLVEFKGKVAGLMATSPGKLGGLRGLYQLNTLLFGMGTIVLPEIVSVGDYAGAFDEEGQLTVEANQKAAAALGARIVQIAEALARGA